MLLEFLHAKRANDNKYFLVKNIFLLLVKQTTAFAFSLLYKFDVFYQRIAH